MSYQPFRVRYRSVGERIETMDGQWGTFENERHNDPGPCFRQVTNMEGRADRRNMRVSVELTVRVPFEEWPAILSERRLVFDRPPPPPEPEPLKPRVGMHLRRASWAKGIYVTVTAIGEQNILAVRSDTHKERTYVGKDGCDRFGLWEEVVPTPADTRPSSLLRAVLGGENNEPE